MMARKTGLFGGALAIAAGLLGGSASASELTFWSWRQEDKAAYQEFIKDFQVTNPNTSVKFEAFEAQTYQTILSTGLAAGRGPDVIQVRAYGNLGTIAKPGYLLPLDKTLVPELANFSETALAAETLKDDGKIYAVPFASQTMLVLYNTEIFEKNGLKAPETWDELLAVCKTLKEKGVTPFGNGTATAWQNETIIGALLSSMLGKEFEADVVAGKATFEDPRFVEALTKLDGLKEYFSPGFQGIDYPSSQQLFVAGRAAMYAGGSYEIANFRRQNPKLKLDVFPAPALKAGDPRLVALYYDGGYAVNAKTEKKDEAVAFVRYLASKQFGDKFANKLGNLSAVEGVTFEDPLLAKVSELNKSAMSYLMLVHFRYQEPSGSVLLQAGVQKMLAGKATPAEVASEITKGIATYYAPFKR